MVALVKSCCRITKNPQEGIVLNTWNPHYQKNSIDLITLSEQSIWGRFSAISRHSRTICLPRRKLYQCGDLSRRCAHQVVNNLHSHIMILRPLRPLMRSRSPFAFSVRYNSVSLFLRSCGLTLVNGFQSPDHCHILPRTRNAASWYDIGFCGDISRGKEGTGGG